MEIKDALKRFRQEFKLNQRQIAATLGIPYQSYQGYEYGRNIPSATIIVKLATAYNVSTDYLLGLTDTPSSIKTPTDEDILTDSYVVPSLESRIERLESDNEKIKSALEKLGITSD